MIVTLSMNRPAPSDLGRRLFRPFVVMIAIAAMAPVLAVLVNLFAASPAEFWRLRGEDYIAGTMGLCVLVAIGATAIGGGAASLVALTEFPGRRFFSVALILPFAIPAYILAYAYADLLSPFGPLAAAAVPLIGEEAARALNPEIRTLPGAAFILTLSVYPYIFLALRASFASRSTAFFETARVLGASPQSAFFRVLAPIARPALAGGLALALMETAADYGVADYFGVRTLSTGIFRTWHGLGDLAAASQLAAVLFLIALLLIFLEQGSRRGLSAENARAHRRPARAQLSPPAAAAASVFCSLVFLSAFVIPVGVLIANALEPLSSTAQRDLASSLANTALVGGVGAVVTMAIALALTYAARHPSAGAITPWLIRMATLGYALPGAVIAIGVLIAIDAAPGASIVNAGLWALIFAFVVRFLTAGYNAAAGGFAQIGPSLDDAARVLGARDITILRRVHLPLSRNALLAGAMIVFVDIAKELPATLLLRPFDFDTMATRIHRLASDERLADAAPAALLLIALSLVAVIALDRLAMREVERPVAAGMDGRPVADA